MAANEEKKDTKDTQPQENKSSGGNQRKAKKGEDRSASAQALATAVESVRSEQNDEPETVTLQALVDLDDSVAGHVDKGKEFETSPQNAKFYQKTHSAGPPGVTAQEILAEVAEEEFRDRKNAGTLLSTARSVHRNLAPGSIERGNVGYDPNPMLGAKVPDPEDGK